METFDQQYVRRYRQHIPFYKSNYPFEDRRVYWHHQRSLCDSGCIFGIPVVQSQYIMFVLEDDAPTDVGLIFSGVSQNTTVELCCLQDGDTDVCPAWSLPTSDQKQFSEYKICVIDGEPVQFNYMRIKVPSNADCGLHYLKITAYGGTANERKWYSQPVYIYEPSDVINRKLIKLNIDDPCNIGGINFSEIYQGWGDPQYIEGYDVYLPDGVATAFVEEVTDSEFEEDGKGNEILQYEKVQYRYEFDTNLVPEFFAEFIKEITHTKNNYISIPDNQKTHKFKIGNAETSMTPDGDGCFLNVNVRYTVNVVVHDACCADDPCECPQDNVLTAISYTTDQVDAEASVDIGDTYIVPNNGSAGPNPDWKVHDNEIAVWNGTGWDYSPSNPGTYVYVEDAGDYYIARGIGNVWEPQDAFIENIVDVLGPNCLYNLTGVIPSGTWVKVQISVSGSGVWSDLNNGDFYTLSDLLSGVEIYIGTAGNWDIRLVHMNIGCSLSNSPSFNLVTSENCL